MKLAQLQEAKYAQDGQVIDVDEGKFYIFHVGRKQPCIPGTTATGAPGISYSGQRSWSSYREAKQHLDTWHQYTLDFINDPHNVQTPGAFSATWNADSYGNGRKDSMGRTAASQVESAKKDLHHLQFLVVVSKCVKVVEK